MTSPASQLVEPETLLARFRAGQPMPVILDASLTLGEGASGYDLFAAGHLPGARFFDLNAHRDTRSDLPRMLLEPMQLARVVRELGVDPQREVLVYDAHGLYSAPRLWWMLRLLGHPRVGVLNGGAPAWRDAGGPLEQTRPDPVEPAPQLQVPETFPAEHVADAQAVQRALDDPQAIVVDARSEGRFTGQVPERSAALLSGHMPGAVNFPYTELMTERGTLVDASTLRARLQRRGITSQRLVSSCGSGVTACVLAWAMKHHFGQTVQVYDGSWSEWGRGEVGEVVRDGPAR